MVTTFDCQGIGASTKNDYGIPISKLITLHVKHANASTIHIIHPHRHYTGSWNPSSCKLFYAHIWFQKVMELHLIRLPSTHGGRETHKYVSELAIIGWDNSLSPGPCQAIIETNAGILLIGTPGTNLSEISIEIHISTLKNVFENIVSEMSAILSRPQCVNRPATRIAVLARVGWKNLINEYFKQ